MSRQGRGVTLSRPGDGSWEDGAAPSASQPKRRTPTLISTEEIEAWYEALPRVLSPGPARATAGTASTPSWPARSSAWDAVSALLIRDEEVPRTQRYVVFLAAALAVLGVAEYLVAYVDALWGLVLHGMLLLAFMLRAVYSAGPAHDLFVALSVLPLIRLLSIAMPFWLTDQTGHFALVNLPLIVATLVAARILRYGRSELGLRMADPAAQLVIVLFGPAIGFVERLIIQPAALVPELTLAAAWWPALSLLLFTGLSEELLFRGVLQTAAVRWMGAGWGIVYVSLMFGLLHMGWQSALDVAFVTVVGLFFGWAVHRTGSIVGVTFAHGAANIFLFLVLPHVGMA